MNTVAAAEYIHPAPAVRARLHTARTQDASELFGTLTLAFTTDPAARWLYPGTGQYLRHFPEFVRAFGGGAVGLGTAYYTDDFAGCALWMAPGESPDEAEVAEVVAHSIPARRHEEVFAVFEAMGAVHPSEPHWYLPLLGVDAAFQGRGLGSTLLRRILEACDRDGVPAYLEATSARNVRLYERHGFQRLQPLRVGTCPPITPMWRAPS